MIDRFKQFPRALAARARSRRLAEVPALLAHPDWERPAPVVLWMHGRTANKELDPGRYLRWIRAGIGACAVDLPGHGERADASMQTLDRSLEVLAKMLAEVDHVIEALADPALHGVFDLSRVAIGGMSAGGMVALRRLCDPHPFACAAVEGTTGWLSGLYFSEHGEAGTKERWAVAHDRASVAALDPMAHLAGWRPIPLLALHNELDEIVPLAGQRRFLEALESQGKDGALVELRTWAKSGAPAEHSGFGVFANEAKNVQTEFLTRVLKPEHPGELN